MLKNNMSVKILFLNSGGCAWGKCLFCGYGRIQGKNPSADGLKKEFDSFFSGLDGVSHVKVFGSGSWLDSKQVPGEARTYFIGLCRKGGVKKLTVESRPEFITKEGLKEFKDIDFEIAIGLETADNRILEKIAKGFQVEDFAAAARTVHSAGGLVRTYLLVNLPFVRDMEGELEKSVDCALKHSDSVVLINLLPHGNCPLFGMWLRGEWNFLNKKEFLQIVEKWKNNPKIEFDAETFRFVPKFPRELRDSLVGVGENFLTHPHFEVWQNYLVRWYNPGREIVLFLPCSYKKPYSESETHRGIAGVLGRLGLRGSIHEVMLSNAGLVPREFENLYPFNAYDWDERQETEEIKGRYIEVTTRRIEDYLKAHHYRRILCFLKYDSESYQALEMACDSLDIKFTNLLSKKTYDKIKDGKRPLQSEEGLSDLEAGLKDEAVQV
ncbi:MAG: DUF5591 domain-containing protein [Candidatus Altiarchaeales archaeon]|nr:DUF5591 domain-containing protein [Candidatus Altiarchaeales archaeon]